MKKLIWFVMVLLLAGCEPNPSPTPIEPIEYFPAEPSATPLFPAPTTWEFRIIITTTSDWTNVRLVEGLNPDDHQIVSTSQGVDEASFDQNTFHLSQALDKAEAGGSVELVVDLSFDEGQIKTDPVIEIDRGHIGSTTVTIQHYFCDQPSDVATFTWDGIQSSGENIQQFTLPHAQLTTTPRNEYTVIAQLNFWYYGEGLYGGFENDLGQRNTALTPLLGDTYAAANTDVVYQQIEWAADYGVDAFSIEWMTPRGVGCCGSMEDTLDDVFLKSPNISKVRWVIFYDFPLRLMQTPGLEGYAAELNFNEPDVYNTFVYDLRRFAQKYFATPYYLKIDGRPVVYVWASNAFQGNVAGALRDARQAIADMGYDVFIVGDEVMAGNFNPQHAALFDANTTFTLLIPGLNPKYWADIGEAIPEVDRTFAQWRDNIEDLKVVDREEFVNFQPAWAPQYDERLSRLDSLNPIYVPATSKDQVLAMAEMARMHAEPFGNQGQKLIWVNTWNCWAETTTIEPTANRGAMYPAGNYQFDMLEVVREVFGAETFACGGP